MNTDLTKIGVKAQIAKLQKQLDYLEQNSMDNLEFGNWVIDLRTNRYYQFLNKIDDGVKLSIKGQSMIFIKKTFDSYFRKANKNLDFYMVTVTGEHGSKVRHETYEIAEAEAIRLAKKLNHEAFIVGVIASVKPKTETVTKVSYNVIKR